jgi:hypothetical protein
VLTLLCATAFALLPTDNLVHFDLTLSAWSGYHELDFAHTRALADGFRAPANSYVYGGGQLAGDLYPHPLRDDDAPATYQAFLQRATRLSFDLGGSGGVGGFLERNSDGTSSSEPTRVHWSFGDVAVDGYPLRWLFLGAGLHIRDDVYLDPSVSNDTLRLTPWAVVGVRLGEARIIAGWSVGTTRSRTNIDGRTQSNDFHVPFYGNAYLDGYFILQRRASLDLTVTVEDHGAQAHGSFSVFFARRLGVDFGVTGGSWRPDPNAPSIAQIDGSVGLSWWFVSRAGVSLSYQPQWRRDNSSFDQLNHVVELSFTVRPR